MHKLTLLLITGLFVTICSTNAQNSLNSSLVGHWGYGSCKTMTINNNYAFIGSGFVLVILDISDISSTPAKVGELQLPGMIMGIEISGNYAYVATGTTGLRIIDISDPYAPTEANSLATPGIARDVAVNGNLLFLSDSQWGSVVIDITDPVNPTVITNDNSYGIPYDIDNFGNTVIESRGNLGISLYMYTPLWGIWSLYTYNIPGITTGVAVTENYAFALTDHTLSIFDISDDVNWFLSSQIALPFMIWGGTGITVSGDYAYVNGHRHGFAIVNISDPANPFIENIINTPGNAWASAVDENILYVADEAYLRVYDLTNSTIVEKNYYHAHHYTEDVVVNGQHAYVTNNLSGIKIINISDISNPYEEGYFQSNDTVRCIAVAGDYAYVGVSETGLRIINISDPANPYETGVLALESPVITNPYDIEVSGDFVYMVFVENYNNCIINVSDPENPVEVAFLGGQSAYDVEIYGNYAYVADGFDGFMIVDINDPDNPFTVGTNLEDLGFAYGIAVSGNYAYVADYDGFLRIFDVTTPSAPEFVGMVETPSSALKVAVSGNYAYVVCAGDGVRIIDVSDPSNPVEVGYYDTPDSAEGVTVNEEFIFVADFDAGMLILQNDLATGISENRNNADSKLQAALYPNPVKGESQLSITLTEKCEVTFTIYNQLGSKVLEKYYPDINTGNHEFTLSTDNFIDGMYLCLVTAKSTVGEKIFQSTIKMVKQKD